MTIPISCLSTYNCGIFIFQVIVDSNPIDLTLLETQFGPRRCSIDKDRISSIACLRIVSGGYSKDMIRLKRVVVPNKRCHRCCGQAEQDS